MRNLVAILLAVIFVATAAQAIQRVPPDDRYLTLQGHYDMEAILPAVFGIKLGATGTSISASYRAAAAIDFASIATAECGEDTLTVTGAAAGDECMLGLPATLEDHLGASCYVSAADTVTIRLCNVTAGAVDPASATFSARTFSP